MIKSIICEEWITKFYREKAKKGKWNFLKMGRTRGQKRPIFSPYILVAIANCVKSHVPL